MKHLTKILIIVTILLGLSSCFKEEKQGTLFNVAVYSQNVSSDEVTHTTTELMSYAFYVPENSSWEVSTWEDAINKCITNTKNKEQRTNPDVNGTWDSEREYQVELGIWSHTVFMVIVDIENKVYATRQYDTPINIPAIYAQLHIYAHKKSGNVNGWTFVNPFPDEEREPLTPSGDENNQTQE